MEAILEGFYEIVPPFLLPVFNEYELGKVNHAEILGSSNTLARITHKWTTNN